MSLQSLQMTTQPTPSIRLALGLAIQAALYWSAVAALRGAGVTLAGWCGLQVLVWLGWWVASRWKYSAALRPLSWAALALQALWGAALFAGANFGLDALHGPNRPKAEVAVHLGGLELWAVLCPGVFSLALGRVIACRALPPPSQAAASAARPGAASAAPDAGFSRSP